MIHAKNISHCYGKEKVLKQINLDIHKNEFVSFIGESGSGKSTLLCALSTLLTPSTGDVFFENLNYKDIPNIDTFRVNNIGFVFQFHYLINYLNVLENITLAKKDFDKNYLNELLSYLGIEHLKKRYPSELSGGQKQRVAIARGLINKPKVLFADEPTGNLDSKNSLNVFTLFKELKKDTTIVVATHDVKLAQNSDKIYEVTDGTISSIC
ncbi:MAG: ABC transporter ATP-binding protein [Candidatus Marinarcus sp.]|uniref:ABC transporter ATP-binding protein n=1 Tax=Candidatus Marinarcus sp. TaxID=3100987 RepID=UPI003AFF76B6